MLTLSKDQKVDLTKNNPTLRIVTFSSSWTRGADLDIAVGLCNAEGNPVGGTSFIYYQQKWNSNYSVHLDKDDRSGGGTLDVPKKNCRIDLSAVPPEVEVIQLYAWVFTGAHSFAEAGPCFLDVRNISEYPDAQPNTPEFKQAIARAGKEAILARYDIDDDYGNARAACLARFYRHKGEWKLQASGVAIPVSSRASGCEVVEAVKNYHYYGTVETPTDSKSQKNSVSGAERGAQIASEVGRRLGGAVDALFGRRR